ncbi:MAG: hypothetical protein CBE48_003085 [Flavobacteriales bacterium TMED288]|nr:hypothetical protein [Flavobacteriales bacterium]RPG53080.1 MAG: hypothetical protein CBE48_003085 [Flavobacteriales bacterium TMED288]|tara:strand:- start:62 stop:424 length:363 start_codon:yes stop_codon:yes gene_type:complete
MKPSTASLINSIILIVFGFWGYISSITPSPTALIPVFFGAILLIINPKVKKQQKIASHLAVIFTILIFFGLIKPLLGAINRSNYLSTLRVLTMMISSLFAFISFVKSFIEVRKTRNKTGS